MDASVTEHSGKASRWKRTVAGACAFAGLLGAIAAGCQGRPRGITSTAPAASSASKGWRSEEPDPWGPHVAELNFSNGLPETGRSGLLAPPSRRTFAEATKLLLDLEGGKEKQIKGLLVLFGMMRTGFSRAQEIGDSLARIRATGVPIVCHADALPNDTYWMAVRGCDRIWVSPAGEVETVGIAGQVMYARRLLGELSIDVDLLQVGKFKGASEPLTRDGPSDEAKESLLGVLRSIRGTWLDSIDTARPGKDLRTAAETGPWSPREARERGMIDEVGYEADAREEVRKRTSIDNVVTRFGPKSADAEAPAVVQFVRLLSGADSEGGTGRPHIAVIRATGAISMSSGGSPLGDGDGIAQDSLSHALEKVRKDDAAKAVVLRVDSPGGSALASDLLWSDLVALRSVKPLVVSVGDMAASGGYYLACAGSRIFAQPTSIVGSIGVVGGKLSFGRGLDRLGIRSEVFPASSAPGAGSRAAYASPFEPWDDPTRSRMLATMTNVYELFVSRVMQGRSLPREKVDAFAQGRLHAGREALGLGMIDELGGLQASIAYARKQAGLDPDAPAYLIAEESGLAHMLGLDDGASERAGSGAFSQAAGLRSVAASYAPDLLAFAGAYEPMLRGEHTLVVVPFAFLLR